MATSTSSESLDLSIVAAVNSRGILRENLETSPCVASGKCPLIIAEGRKSAAIAYNESFARSQSALVAFVHQDVYLPQGWERRVADAVESLDAVAAPWAVLGVWGVRSDKRFFGRVWCTGSQREFRGDASPAPVQVESIDEIVIILRRDSGVRFDEGLPGFHLYATDVALEARRRGFGTFVIDAPVIHNSRFNDRPVDRSYMRGYSYMRRKWFAELPVQTAVLPITRYGLPLIRHLIRREAGLMRRGWRLSSGVPVQARNKAMALGYESSCGNEGCAIE